MGGAVSLSLPLNQTVTEAGPWDLGGVQPERRVTQGPWGIAEAQPCWQFGPRCLAGLRGSPWRGVVHARPCPRPRAALDLWSSCSPPPPHASADRSSCARAHLLLPDAVVLKDHEEELRGEVAVQGPGAAEPVQEREDELCVLGHRQAPVQGLCRRGWAEGRRVGRRPGCPACGLVGRAGGLRASPEMEPMPGAPPCRDRRRVLQQAVPAPPSSPQQAAGPPQGLQADGSPLPLDSGVGGNGTEQPCPGQAPHRQ